MESIAGALDLRKKERLNRLTYINLSADVEPFNFTDVVYLMAIYDNKTHRDHMIDLEDPQVGGLILVQDNQVKGQFRRLGIFNIFGDGLYYLSNGPIISNESYYLRIETKAEKKKSSYFITIV
jgi:hypothetical protein